MVQYRLMCLNEYLLHIVHSEPVIVAGNLNYYHILNLLQHLYVELSVVALHRFDLKIFATLVDSEKYLAFLLFFASFYNRDFYHHKRNNRD